MTSIDHVSHSDDSDMLDLVQTPKKKENPGELSMSGSALSHRYRASPQAPAYEHPRVRSSTSEEKKIVVMVQGPSRPWEYQPFVGENTVDTVLAEIDGPGGDTQYRIEYEDGRREDVSLEDLLELRNGRNALNFYNNGDAQSGDPMADSQVDRSSAEPSVSSSNNGKRTRTKTKKPGFVNSTQTSSDEHILSVKKRRTGQGRTSLLSNNQRTSSRLSSRQTLSRAGRDEESHSESHAPTKSRLRSSNRTPGRQTRLANNTKSSLKFTFTTHNHDDADELAESDGSEVVYYQPKKNLRGGSDSKGKRRRPRRNVSDSDASSERPEPTRRSGRERAIKSMKEVDMDEEVYADEVTVKNVPKVISIREIYLPVSKKSPFYAVHSQKCDVCHNEGTASNKGTSPLVHCQGCSSSIHKLCLGYRSGREHIVTKVGPENFVLQCRRCIGLASKKEPSAPRLDTCQMCKEPGLSCAAFSTKKTSKQEEKLREENGGDDPITEVSMDLVNNADNVLFRCEKCHRAWHLEHLPPLGDGSETLEDLAELRSVRINEYSLWHCKDCVEMLGKVEKLVAWRPADRRSYAEGDTVEMFSEDQKEYLLKWADKSYFKCTWMPGAWVWGVTVGQMRKSFVSHNEGANLLPKWTFEEAVREEYLRIEIIFDVKYDGYRPRSEKSDKSHITDIDQVLVKFAGLSYDNAVWDDPPNPDDGDRWTDFVAAYDEYLAGKYFKSQSPAVLKARIEDFRKLNYEEVVGLKAQPSTLVGGEMYDYQKDGMNWLIWKFHQKKNVILADEMGLGKTIQVIAFLTALVAHEPKCWPFLIVTPNSTCPNWRREIKKWAPSIRVVAYYGGKKARDMAEKYELFPGDCDNMRAHVVVTSYDAPVNNPELFKKVKWAGMIVDEGQRLKNDENLLYSALKALKIPFQALLTGTPLQNNKRELFNLLQFCDPSLSAAQLDAEYEVLTKANIRKLHKLIRPFFLRRTKAEVLELPPMAQVILPVTMSVVQKKLYRSILAKNPDLIKSLFDQTKTALKPKDRGNLNNVLMQLRKCLCHPFLYSSAIEEKGLDENAMNRNLIDASSKFQLLEIMLPKLRERGNRVLLFSQFLDQLDIVEDFMNALDLPFQRLDGTITAMEKQRRIDAFNAPDSELFAFLLSTRAGGVGINLATADTVIIMDPDFNPYQDIQALSRAHRIGQEKNVLCFQLMTKGSAEEKIVQIGRKKMALGALIESMDEEDDAPVDLQSILKHGAAALFDNDDSGDIPYDSADVDELLERTEKEITAAGKDKTIESQFSFARVWANSKGALTEDIGDADAEAAAPDNKFWENILQQRIADAAAEKAKNEETFGRGKRSRGEPKNYGDRNQNEEFSGDEAAPHKQGRKRRERSDSASDVDFADAGDSDADEDFEGHPERANPQEFDLQLRRERSRSKFLNQERTDGVPYQPNKPPQKSRKPHVSRTAPIPAAANENKNGDLRLVQLPGGHTSVDDYIHEQYNLRYGPSAPAPAPGPLRANSTGGSSGERVQYGTGIGQVEGRSALPHGNTNGFGGSRQAPVLPPQAADRVCTAGAVVQPTTGNRPSAGSYSQNSGASGGLVIGKCQICGDPHRNVCRECPRDASESKLRIMIDTINQLRHTMPQLELNIYQNRLETQLISRAQKSNARTH